jgi:hypothetical protein
VAPNSQDSLAKLDPKVLRLVSRDLQVLSNPALLSSSPISKNPQVLNLRALHNNRVNRDHLVLNKRHLSNLVSKDLKALNSLNKQDSLGQLALNNQVSSVLLDLSSRELNLGLELLNKQYLNSLVNKDHLAPNRLAKLGHQGLNSHSRRVNQDQQDLKQAPNHSNQVSKNLQALNLPSNDQLVHRPRNQEVQHHNREVLSDLEHLNRQANHVQQVLKQANHDLLLLKEHNRDPLLLKEHRQDSQHKDNPRPKDNPIQTTQW